MNAVIEFVFKYQDIFWAVIAFVLYVWKDWEKLKSEIYAYIGGAKRMALTSLRDGILKSGKEQENWAVDTAWVKLPIRFKTIIGTKERLRKLIHWLYTKAKDKADDGKLNGSII